MTTSKDAAIICGVSVRRIQQWATQTGKQKAGRDYDFSFADLHAIISRKGRMGRPSRTTPKSPD